MKKLGLISTFLFSFLIITSVSEAAYGPYLDLNLSGNSRRIEETCPTPPNCKDQFTGLLVSKFYGNADSTRLLATLGIQANLFDLYVSLGGATMGIDEFDGFHGKMAPAYGGGLKFYMYQSPTYEHFTLFINPDYIYFKTNDVITFQSQSSGSITENHEISWNEFLVKMGGSARYDMFEPYGGVQISRIWGQETGDFWGSADISERDNLGFFLGANYYFDPTGRASVYGEIGGGDTAYLKVGIKSRF